METSAAPMSAATAAATASTVRAEAARRGIKGRGSSGGASEGGVNWGRRGRGVGGGCKEAEECINAMVYNNFYVDGRWGIFRHAGAVRLITCEASLAGFKLPVSPIEPTCKACPAFHIKGMCNTGCGNAADHIPHTQEQDLPLWRLALQATPEIKAPAAPIA